MTSIDSWASRRGSQVAVSTVALRENVCSARDQRQHNCLPGKVQNLFARRLVSWPHGAQDSEAIFTAKIVWSCGGRAIEHGVGLERKGRLEAGYGVDRGTSWSIRLGDEVEPFGLEFMAAKRNLWWSDQQGSSDMKGDTRVDFKCEVEFGWRTVVEEGCWLVTERKTGCHVWRRWSGIRCGI